MAAAQAGASRLAAASIPASTLRRCNRLKAVSESRSFQFTRASPRSFTLRTADFLHPADSGFDELADLQARRVALVARGARIDGRTAGPGGVLRHMRGDLLRSQGLDKRLCV